MGFLSGNWLRLQIPLNLCQTFRMRNLTTTLCLTFLVLVWVTACDDSDGLLPLSEYENVDVNVYFYFPNNKEIHLGRTRGARSCGNISYSYARQKDLSRNDGWSYICCTIRKGSQCYEKIR